MAQGRELPPSSYAPSVSRSGSMSMARGASYARNRMDGSQARGSQARGSQARGGSWNNRYDDYDGRDGWREQVWVVFGQV
jgi:hypothetical protein